MQEAVDNIRLRPAPALICIVEGSTGSVLQQRGDDYAFTVRRNGRNAWVYEEADVLKLAEPSTRRGGLFRS